MHRVHVFLNRHAAQSSVHDWESLIRTKLYRSQLTFARTENALQFQAAIEAAVAAQVDVVIAVGGDGTINHLIQQLAGQDIAFLVLPAGTANDLARALGVYAASLPKAVDVVRQDRWLRMDLIAVNGRYMATNGGIGLVADVAQTVNHLRHVVPGFRFLMRTMKQEVYGLLLGTRLLTKGAASRHLHITSDRFTGEVTTPLLLINNQSAIGGSFTVAPHTRHDDGMFNVTVFTPRSTGAFVASAYRVRRQFGPENDPQILSFESSAVQIKALDGRDLDFVGDGELLVSSTELEVGIKPKALKVFTQARRLQQRGGPA